MVFITKMDGYQKICDTNKNVTKMGVIIRGIYYTNFQSDTIGMYLLLQDTY
jgi:hypothetical protein